MRRSRYNGLSVPIEGYANGFSPTNPPKDILRYQRIAKDKLRSGQSLGAQVEIDADFAEVHDILEVIKRIYTRPDKELPNMFRASVFTKKPDVALYSELLSLARTGLDLVRKHFSSMGDLYNDGGFWYDLFEMISLAALNVNEGSKTHHRIQEKFIIPLTEILVDISEYTSCEQPFVDIYKRNQEALGDTLIVFYREDLFRMARRRSRKTGSKTVRKFVSETIRLAKKRRVESES